MKMADRPDLVERRRQYIERQIALDTGHVNVQLRDDVVAIRQPLARRALQDDRRACRAEGRGAIRPLHGLRRKGFWEVRGYSNSAEPWFDDRYSTGD
jgi:hypothetical protein